MQLLAVHDVVGTVTSLQVSTAPVSLFEFKLELGAFFAFLHVTRTHTPVGLHQQQWGRGSSRERPTERRWGWGSSRERPIERRWGQGSSWERECDQRPRGWDDDGGVDHVDGELHALEAVVVLGADEPHLAGLVELHDVVAGAPGLELVVVIVAHIEVFLADLNHRVFPLGVLEHYETIMGVIKCVLLLPRVVSSSSWA